MGWSQQFTKNAPKDLPQHIVKNGVAVAKKIYNDDGTSTPILTLGHLAFVTGTKVGFLRDVVSRKDPEPYKTFLLAKPSKSRTTARGFRVISVPANELSIVQKWVSDNILAHQYPHPASKAYSRGSKLVDAVTPHLKCRWLIKIDVQTFFDSISEIAVYRVFESIGYQPLVSFELARLCTRLGKLTGWRSHPKWYKRFSRQYKIRSYRNLRIGHLPQGAPSSPMLSNLVMRKFDEIMSDLAGAAGFVYSRYADDLAFSTRKLNKTKHHCEKLVNDVYKQIANLGLSPNLSKTKISPPGARKILLGLLIDGPKPNLTKEFRRNLSQHLYYIKKYGPTEHANRKGFDSTTGLRNHLFGLAHYTRQICPDYGKNILAELNAISWPI